MSLALSAVRLLPLLPLLLLTGCVLDQYRLAEPSQLANQRVGLAEVMAEMDARRSAVQTLIASLDLCLTDTQTGKKASLDGAYAGDKDGNFRLVVKYEETRIMDLAMNGEQVTLWLPRKNRLYQGTRKELRNSKGNELALLGHIGNAHDLFFPRAWCEGATQRRAEKEDGQDVVWVIEKSSKFRPARVLRKLTIQSDQPMASQILVYSQRAFFLGKVLYGDYHCPAPLAGDAREARTQVVYPGRVTLLPDGSRQLQMDITELRLNEPLPITAFDVQVENQPVLSLDEALRNGKSLWE